MITQLSKKCVTHYDTFSRAVKVSCVGLSESVSLLILLIFKRYAIILAYHTNLIRTNVAGSHFYIGKNADFLLAFSVNLSKICVVANRSRIFRCV